MGIYVSLLQIPKYNLDFVDKYFDRFGYTINEIKVPQWNSRPLFNYIKTSGSNIAGTIPSDSKAEINNLLNNGITVWHDIDEFGEFDGANNLAPFRPV